MKVKLVLLFFNILVDGKWSSWSSQSFCTKTCGDLEGGVRLRTRSCTNPNPEHGGESCQGISRQTSTCGETCYHLALLIDNNIGLFALDEPGILDLDLDFPKNFDVVPMNSDIIGWKTGLLLCPQLTDGSCHYWDMRTSSWEQMTTKPHKGEYATYLTHGNRIWKFGGRLKF